MIASLPTGDQGAVTLAGAAIVLRLDPDGAARLAAALTHAADRMAQRGACLQRPDGQKGIFP